VQAETGTAAACSKVRLAGFRREPVSRRERVFREGSAAQGVAAAEDVIARPDLRHVAADRLDSSGEVNAPDVSLGCRKPQAHEAHQVGQAGREVPHAGIDPSRVDAHEHIIVTDRGRGDVVEPQHVRRPVRILDYRFHRALSEE
jgi:hypothetical protein